MKRHMHPPDRLSCVNILRYPPGQFIYFFFPVVSGSAVIITGTPLLHPTRLSSHHSLTSQSPVQIPLKRFTARLWNLSYKVSLRACVCMCVCVCVCVCVFRSVRTHNRGVPSDLSFQLNVLYEIWLVRLRNMETGLRCALTTNMWQYYGGLY